MKKNYRPDIKLEEIIRDNFYSVKEISSLLNVSERTLRRYCEEKIFANSIKLGKKGWLVPGCDVLLLCGIGQEEIKLNEDTIVDIDINIEELSW